MAAVTVLKTVGNNEDDEAWLYGDAENKEPGPPGTEQVQLTAPSDQPGGEPSQDADDDDSDDDDDVQVTIGDIKAFPMNNAAAGLYKPPATYQKQPVVAGPKIGTTTQAVKGVDVEAEGTINGVGVYEFSLDSLLEEEKPWRKPGVDIDAEGTINGMGVYEFSLDSLLEEEKPWRKPGADITDYFNYGFNEDTWRKYCQKQNRLRAENGGTIPRTYTTGMTNTFVKVESIGSGYTDNSRYIQPKPTPNVAPIGTIAVLGSTTASRRPMEEQINEMEQQMGGAPDEMKPGLPPPGMPPPGMNMPPPNYNLPPPGMPPIPTFPPAVPPPGMGVPPPGMFAQPPPVPFFPPHQPMPPNANFGERPPFSYENAPSHPAYPESSGDKPAWESRDRDRDSYRERDRDRDRERDREGGEDYSRSRDYSSSRDYDRGDYYSRSSDRSRSDRDRSRSRERDRRHRDRDRDRDDKKSKSRKVKDEPDDSDYYKSSSSSSSKHKKSKRSKRDKDDDREGSDREDK